MDIDRIEELLPWLASGTLTPDERGEVVAYLASHPSARQAVEATAFALASLGGHPAEEALLALAYDHSYAHGNAVIGHVAGCADCAEAVALARVARATPLERQGAAGEKTAGVLRSPLLAGRRPRAWRGLAAAAAIAVTMGSLGWWQGTRARRGGVSGEAPPIEAPALATGHVGLSRPMIVAVVPSSLRQRGRGNETLLVLASDRDGFIVDVQLPKAARDVGQLSVRLESAGGEAVPLSVGPRSDDDPDLVAVPIPSAVLRSATVYELVVEDAETGRVLDRYLLRTP